MRLLLTLILCAALLAVSSAAPVPKDADKPKPYYPTTKGTTWTYRSGNREESFVISEVQQHAGAIIVSIGRISQGQPVWEKDVKVAEDELSVLKVAGIPGFSLQLLALPAKTGDIKDMEMPYGKGVMKWQRVVRGIERVKTPAGTFDALRVEHLDTLRNPDGSAKKTELQMTEWFVQGMGVVREASGEKAETEAGVMVSFTPGVSRP